MTTFKLTYFDFDGGRAEPIRIAFHAAGIAFEDERLSFQEFGEMRHSTRFNAVPVLQIDGAAVTQTNAMCRYVGRMAGLYPEEDRQALHCDEVMSVVEDNSHPSFQKSGARFRFAIFSPISRACPMSWNARSRPLPRLWIASKSYPSWLVRARSFGTIRQTTFC